MKIEVNRTVDNKLYKVLKVKNKDCYSIININKNETSEMHFIDVDLNNRKKLYTLVKESEVTRIIRCLNLENNSKLDYNFVLVNDLISIDVSTKTYKENDLGIIYVRKLRKLQKNKYGVEEIVSIEKYKRLLASTGGIRSNKVTYIKEDLFDKANEILLCGMPSDMEFEFFSKFSAYYALAATDSTPVTFPNILVVKDYVLPITEEFDIVTETIVKGEDRISPRTNKVMLDKEGNAKKYPDTLKYDCKTGSHTDNAKCFDGAGLVDISLAKVWMHDLNLNYVPSSFQFRAIPGIKGNVYTVDIQKFAKQHSDIKTIVDAWGNNVDLYDENGNFCINVILTVSQFKFFAKYNSFEQWLDVFNIELYGYKRTFNIANVGEKYNKLKDKTLLSYQPLQSLKLEQEQIDDLCKDTIDTITEISTDVDKFLKYRGFDETDSQIPEYYKAMAVNKELFFDPWIQQKVKNDIDGFKEKTYRGSLFILGNFQTLIPDVKGLIEFAFGLQPEGLLKKDEAYSNYWVNKEVEEVGVVRYPHIAMEWGLIKVVAKTPEMNFYKYITTGIIVSMYDTLALKINSGDFDGDEILTINDNILKDAVRNQMSKTIAFVPKKVEVVVNKDGETPPEEPHFHKINEMKEIIKTDVLGMSNNIGRVINKISILWSMPQDELRDKYIKIMSIIGSLTIDFVKTGIKTPIPKEILKYIEGQQLPKFMKTRYKDKTKLEKVLNKNDKLLGGKGDIQLFNDHLCTMNLICDYMHEQIDGIKLTKEVPNFDFITRMVNKDVNKYNDTYSNVVLKLKEMKQESDDIARLKIFDDNGDCDTEKIKERDYMYKTFYEYCKIELLSLCTKANSMDTNKLIDCLIYAFFCDDKFALENQDKAILWNCFGKQLTTRFKGKIRKTESFSEEKINKLAERANKLQEKRVDQKKKKDANNKTIAKISILIGEEKITIYKDEVKFIANTLKKNPEARSLAIGLLVLDRFCKGYKQEFYIYQNKRNTINKNQLSVLTGINPRHYDELIGVLTKSSVIELKKLSPKKDSSVLKCNINDIKVEDEKCFVMTDINDVSKILKNIRTLGKIFK